MWFENHWGARGGGGVLEEGGRGLQIIFDMDGWLKICGCGRGRCRSADIDR